MSKWGILNLFANCVSFIYFTCDAITDVCWILNALYNHKNINKYILSER